MFAPKLFRLKCELRYWEMEPPVQYKVRHLWVLKITAMASEALCDSFCSFLKSVYLYWGLLTLLGHFLCYLCHWVNVLWRGNPFPTEIIFWKEDEMMGRDDPWTGTAWIKVTILTNTICCDYSLSETERITSAWFAATCYISKYLKKILALRRET